MDGSMMAGLTGAVARIFRHADGLVFVALSAALAWLLLSGNDTAFLHPRFRPFLMGGILLLVAFIIVMVCGPKRHHTSWQLATLIVQALVLAMPLLFLVFSMGQSMGAHALNRKSTGMEQQTLARLLGSGKRQPLATGRAPTLSLLEAARQMKQLDGKRVVTEGLVYRPAIMPPNYLTLFRFAIFCCAADALPVWLFVEHPNVTAFDDENWIRVDGTLTIVNFNGIDVPVIKADTIEKKTVPPTAEQYLFF
jgi:putative membrane protein